MAQRPIDNLSILITGGGSGIGVGTAKWFAERGARVTISGRRPDKIRGVADEIGERCRAVVGDVTSSEDRSAMIDAAVDFGDGLDVLVNNAANMYPGPITQVEEQPLLDLFHSNVVAPMMLTREATPHLENSRGAVIFFGSVHAAIAYPGASPYAATKGALQVLTRVVAAELGPLGIRVNCVIPGAVFTEIGQRAGLLDDEAAYQRLQRMASDHVLGRIGEPEEIAEAIGYLVTAEWTTGSILVVDGGLALGARDVGLPPADHVRREEAT